MLRPFKADLHVHTCLSPCGDLKMSPRAIADMARERDIEILGICDHNSAENVPAVQKAAGSLQISVLPGIEVTTQEEIHLLALFGDQSAALRLQALIYDNLPGENDEDLFGMQVVVNEKGEVLGFNKRLLIGASTLPIDKVVAAVHDLDGIAIASHIDKEAFSLISQLGFIPDHLELDALEISRHTTLSQAAETFRSRLPLTRSSDAHFPEEVGSLFTTFLIKEATIEEIRLALLNKDGRDVIH